MKKNLSLQKMEEIWKPLEVIAPKPEKGSVKKEQQKNKLPAKASKNELPLFNNSEFIKPKSVDFF
jgi:hypothetical protein